MTLKEKMLLVGPFLGCGYNRIRVRSDYSVEVQRKPGQPWSLLMNPTVAKRQLSHQLNNSY
jgi:hypothetical protein